LQFIEHLFTPFAVTVYVPAPFSSLLVDGVSSIVVPLPLLVPTPPLVQLEL